jgi:hypothetical protein
MSPNRLVALLTPLVFAPLAGAVAAWLANHAPGVDVNPDDLQQIFIAGALIALAPAAQWLHGWQKYEARQADADLAIQVANAQAAATTAVAPGQPADTFDDDFLDEADEFDMLDDAELAPNGQRVAAGG